MTDSERRSTPTAPVHAITEDAAARGIEADSVEVSSLSLADKLESSPSLTATSKLVVEAKTIGSESKLSSEREKDEGTTEQQRQVIAVSVSKSPSAFFNLARRFLVSDEECDLSALEGAIISAVDAAHLLERSKIATIVR